MTTNVRPLSSIAAGAEAEIVVIRANVSRSYTRLRPSSSIRVVYVPFFFSASLTSNRSAKSESASTRTVSSIGSSAWLRMVSSSWNPSPTARWRITDSFASTYTVPVPGTRKNRASKYCRSSTESELRRSPLTVSTQVDRNRVSNENRPVGSVSDASMSPRGSLTTKVFPSRILTTPSLTIAFPSWSSLASRVPGAPAGRAGTTPAGWDRLRATRRRAARRPSRSPSR